MSKVKVVETVNFASKRERKKYRKSLRAKVANKAVDRALAKADRAAFYRELRLMKVRRRVIADRLGHTADMLAGLLGEVQRTGAVMDPDPVLHQSALSLVRRAQGITEAAAADAQAFAKKRIYQRIW